nr:MAG TPA: hypothetical protein [Caudoviricetes sp.]
MGFRHIPYCMLRHTGYTSIWVTSSCIYQNPRHN